MSAILAAAMRRAGIDGTGHKLRHWYGTTLLISGADIRTVQDLMRHASVQTTEIYTHSTDRRRAAAIAALDPFYDDRLAVAA